MSIQQSLPIQNQLLRLLPRAEFSLFSPHQQAIDLPKDFLSTEDEDWRKLTGSSRSVQRVDVLAEHPCKFLQPILLERVDEPFNRGRCLAQIKPSKSGTRKKHLGKRSMKVNQEISRDLLSARHAEQRRP